MGRLVVVEIGRIEIQIHPSEALQWSVVPFHHTAKVILANFCKVANSPVDSESLSHCPCLPVVDFILPQRLVVLNSVTVLVRNYLGIFSIVNSTIAKKEISVPSRFGGAHVFGLVGLKASVRVGPDLTVHHVR